MDSWDAMRLFAFIKKRDDFMVNKSIVNISNMYSQPEIKQIWKKIKLLLSSIDEDWFVQSLRKIDED